MNSGNNYNRSIGRKIILNAIQLDESLAEMLKIEVKRFKKLTNGNINPDELKRIHNLIKNTIIALTLTEEKLKTGIELYKDERHTE